MFNTSDLLFELGTEELPPKSLKKMAKSLLEGVCQNLDTLNISYKDNFFYASPRRLAFIIRDVQKKQKDTFIEKQGPLLDIAYSNFHPTKAALGFAKACGVDVKELSIIDDTTKGKRFFYRKKQKGQETKKIIANVIENVLKKLPVSKVMHWSDKNYNFVRPVHWALLLIDNELINHSFYGCKTSHFSYGHRFHHPYEIYISHPSQYVKSLENAYVLVDWEYRKLRLTESAHTLAKACNATVMLHEDLVEEINAIVEYPNTFLCSFDKKFLRVPQEVLISVIEKYQKCFVLTNQENKVINYFITISNIKSFNPKTVIDGNIKVMTARLSDASFFYDSDINRNFKGYVEKLKKVSFQKELGSVYDRTQRIVSLAQSIAEHINLTDIEQKLVHRAAYLSKADLTTEMVYEFTHLQGTMGKYYAQAYGEHELVCQAIEEQYWPKYSGDNLPTNPVAKVLAIAEKLDTLVGIFGIGKKPTGDKDPFALRRAAIGVLRILKEDRSLSITLSTLISFSMKNFSQKQLKIHDIKKYLEGFLIERLRIIYKEQGVPSNVFESVKSVQYKDIYDFNARINAVMSFRYQSICDQLSRNNKRIKHILIKNEGLNFSISPNKTLFTTPEEKSLFKVLNDMEDKFLQLIFCKKYQKALMLLSTLDDSISNFFAHVMIIDSNVKIKNNRLSLLRKISMMFNQVADLSIL